MNKPTLTQIKKHVIDSSGSYQKQKMRLNGNDCYEVNEKLYTKPQLIEAFKMGIL